MSNRTSTLIENVSISFDDLTPQIPVQKDGHGSDANQSHNPTEQVEHQVDNTENGSITVANGNQGLKDDGRKRKKEIEKSEFQKALENHDESKMMELLQTDDWKKYLQRGTNRADGFNKILHTPMRQLIRNFPSVAKTVLDKCKEVKSEGTIRTTIYNYEFLEDTFKYKWGKDQEEFIHVTNETNEEEKYSSTSYLHPYTHYGRTFVENHPLMKINDYKHPKLLMHDVTKNLINDKWNSFGFYFYYTNLIFYGCFLATLTTNVMTSYWPQNYPAFYTCSSYFENQNFTSADQTYALPSNALKRGTYNYVSRVFIMIFASIRLLSIISGHEIKWIIWVSKCIIYTRNSIVDIRCFLSNNVDS